MEMIGSTSKDVGVTRLQIQDDEKKAKGARGNLTRRRREAPKATQAGNHR